MDAPSDEEIRAAYAAFSARGEFDDTLFHPDVEYHNDPKWPGAGVHHGAEAVRRDIARQLEAWDEIHFEPVGIVRASDDKIVALIDMRVTGKTSGAPVGVEGAHVLTLRDGKVAKVEAFTDRERAFAAAGLPSRG